MVIDCAQEQQALKALIYLHGFNSSPGSRKAAQTVNWLQGYLPEVSCLVPQLPYAPQAAIEAIERIVASVDEPVFVGSSLGGYYANYCAEKYGAKAAMVNPAVYPHRLLQGYLGPQTNPYTGESYTLQTQHMQELEALFVTTMQQPEDRWVLLQTGDETLDYREALGYFGENRCEVESGGDHAFVNFDRWLPDIAKFLELDTIGPEA